MLKKLREFLKSCGIKAMLTLTAGVFIAQIISYVAQPLLTRLYSPESFGINALIVSVVSMFTPVLTLQYDQFIVISDSDDDGKKLTTLSLYLSFIVTLAVCIGLFIYNNILKRNTFFVAGNWIYLSIPLMLLTGVINVLTAYNNRLGCYNIIAQVNIFRTLSQSVFKVLFGMWDKSFIGLTIGTIIGCVTGLGKHTKCLGWKLSEFFSYSIGELWTVAKTYKEQPLFSTPGFFVSNLSYSILPVMLSSLYNTEEVGYFSLSMTMLGIPLSLISDSVGKVFLKKASQEKADNGGFYVSYRNTSVLLLAIALPAFTLLYFIAEPAFFFVFGASWIRSGTFVKILIPLYIVRFVVSVMVQGLIISGKQLMKLIIQMFFIVEAVVAFSLSKSFNLSIELFLSITGTLYACNYIVIWIAGYHASRSEKGIYD